MTEIEDRDLRFKSYKNYAKALALEIRKLQQLLPSKEIQSAYESVKNAVRKEELKAELIFGE